MHLPSASPPSSRSPSTPKEKKEFAELPVELKLKIYKYCLADSTSAITSSLKLTCKEFYVFYNELFHEKLHKEFGSEFINRRLLRILNHFIKPYIKSFDYWRGVQRKMIAEFLSLQEPDFYFKDSYQLIYSIFKNKRLFASYEDYKIDEPSNYRYNNFVSINKTYLLSYRKTIQLTPDTYNLACGIIVENVLGLSTTKFQVLRHDTGEELLVYYPPSNINDILPKDKFVLLNLGDFKVSLAQGSTDKLVQVDIIMEETGLYIKSGFSICFIDINMIQPNHTDHIVKIPSTANQVAPTPHTSSSSTHLLSPFPSTTSLESHLNSHANFPPASSSTSLSNIAADSNTNLINSTSSIFRPRRRSSISLNSTMAAVQTEDFNFHNFLFWYVENDISPPFKQNLCNLMLKNIYKLFEMTGENGGDHCGDSIAEIQLDLEHFDVSPYEDIDGYNHKFFSRYCVDQPGEKIKRVFKFITIIQQRNYDMEVAKSTKELELRKAMGLIDGAEILDKYSPLKWKMQTLLQL